MNKSLQILLGLVLILVLAYVSFLDVSSKIKDDLLLKTKTMFSNKNVRNVSVKIQGEGLSMSRTLVLTGTAISEVERVRIVTLTENIEGVCSVDNQIILHPKVPKTPLVPKVPTTVKAPLVKETTEEVIVENTSKEAVVTKSTNEVAKEKKTVASPKVPVVPVVSTQDIIVPTAIKAVAVPKVIEVEKIKLEGVK